MMALEVGDMMNSGYKRGHDNLDNEDESIEETPEEKRLRLAQIYLEEIKRRGTNSTVTPSDQVTCNSCYFVFLEEEAHRHEESTGQDRVNEVLRQNELEENQKAFKTIADKYNGYGKTRT